jgi:uncharacterized membrane protein YecN with MAPEG domain
MEAQWRCEMKEQSQRLSMRDRYRALVSLLIIPLGLIIIVRSSMAGLQAWTLIILGTAFVALGIYRLRAYVQYKRTQGLTPGKGKRA